MITKETAGYRERARDPKRRCEHCTMFRALKHSCTLVEGYISAQAVCERFEAKR